MQMGGFGSGIQDMVGNVQAVKGLFNPKKPPQDEPTPILTATPSPRSVTSGEPAHMLGSFKHGTDYVPKTGAYKLHEGEKVIPKEKNMKDIMSMTASGMGGKSEAPKKEIKEMRIRKSHSGGHIIEHHHHHPEHHPMEEHTTKNMDELHDHMEDHSGSENPGEAEADAGQMTAAPSAAPADPGAAGAMPGM